MRIVDRRMTYPSDCPKCVVAVTLVATAIRVERVINYSTVTYAHLWSISKLEFLTQSSTPAKLHNYISVASPRHVFHEKEENRTSITSQTDVMLPYHRRHATFLPKVKFWENSS